MENLRAEHVWIICVLGSIALIGSLILVGEIIAMIRDGYTAKLDVAQPKRLERFSLEAYQRGVKDASRRNVEEDEE